MRTRWVLATFWLALASSTSGQALDEVTVKGQFEFGRRLEPYMLRVTYAPQPAQLPYYPDLPRQYRRIARIELTIAGKHVAFPAAAYADLWFAHRVWPPLEGRSIVQFDIEGGDGEKGYEVRFTCDHHRLIKREMTRHMTKPQITFY
jgi:hypothetical protein